MRKGLILFLVAALIGTGMWGYDQYQQNFQTSLFLENQYQRMFEVMITDVENIQANLGKVMVTSSPRKNVMLFSDITKLSYNAQEKLGQLPIEHGSISRTTKFLSQVGDISTAFAKKNLDGKPLNHEEMNILQELHNYSNFLAQQLIALQAGMVEDGIRIGELSAKLDHDFEEANQNMMTTTFMNVEERMQEYPELIYDGPFSEHIKKKKPHLTGKKVEKNELIKIAEKFVNNGSKYEINVLGENNNTRIPAYLIELHPVDKNDNNKIIMSITKNAGKVVWMLNTKDIKAPKYSERQGIEIAQKYLAERGYKNMVPTYSIRYDGQIVINFVYSQNDIIIYPDLIKVKVALDEGEVVGFEAEGYLFNHNDRKLDEPAISKEEARELINMNAKVSRVRLTVIPTECGNEVLAYEFKAQFKKDTFLIYINAQTGEEEKIFQVIINDNGVLML